MVSAAESWRLSTVINRPIVDNDALRIARCCPQDDPRLLHEEWQVFRFILAGLRTLSLRRPPPAEAQSRPSGAVPRQPATASSYALRKKSRPKRTPSWSADLATCGPSELHLAENDD